MDNPAVSVIIPAYNAARHIGEALDSVCRQTLLGFEVLVIDDGSKDATVSEVERFAGTLDLTLIRQANGGASAARNTGILRARGKYCAFLDADDVMLPNRLSVELEMLSADADLALVHSDLMTFDDRGIIHHTRRAFSDPRGGMVLERLLLDNFITTSTVMARKDRLIDVGMFNVRRRISHDFELWLRMAARWKVAYIEQALVRYRYRPGSLSDDKLATAIDALEVIETFWREHPEQRRALPDVYRNSLAAHLSTAGMSALAHRKRASALGYLLQSLRFDPWSLKRWKSLAKVAWRPSSLAATGSTATPEAT